MARANKNVGCWLPEHQAHVLYSVAHVDSTIEQLSNSVHDYLGADPIRLTTRYTGTDEEVVLAGMAPLPQCVPRLFADALNQARNVLEHALFAEAEKRLERELTSEESRALEVPAANTEAGFHAWTQHKHRRSIGLFQEGSELRERLLRLQPLHRADHDAHPLRVLVEHTNFAKHREPTVSLTRVGRVDIGRPDLHTALSGRSADHQEILQVGSVLAKVPLGTRTDVSLWPQVVVQRPHTGEWRTLAREIAELEDWVRRIALPILVAGQTDLPPIPPDLDITVGYESIQAAWTTAKPDPASARSTSRMVAEGYRRDLIEMLVESDGPASRNAYTGWLGSLADADLIGRFTPLSAAAARGDAALVERTLRQWRTEAGL